MLGAYASKSCSLIWPFLSPEASCDGSYSNSSKRLITGAGSTALWGINHLWTSKKTTTKNGRDRVKYCDHKKGGKREDREEHSVRCVSKKAIFVRQRVRRTSRWVNLSERHRSWNEATLSAEASDLVSLGLALREY